MTASLRRFSSVTLGLVLAGAVVGALCGIAALAPFALVRLLHPSPDDNFYSVWDVVPWAATVGSVLGAVLGPVLAWGLLRRAPLWRVVRDLAIGSVCGASVGWTFARAPWMPRVGLAVLLLGGVLGAVVAGILLRRRVRDVHLPSA